MILMKRILVKKLVLKRGWLKTHTGHRSTQVTGQYRSLQVNNILSTKTDIGFVR